MLVESADGVVKRGEPVVHDPLPDDLGPSVHIVAGGVRRIR
jgi:hypothetical protein